MGCRGSRHSGKVQSKLGFDSKALYHLLVAYISEEAEHDRATHPRPLVRLLRLFRLLDLLDERSARTRFIHRGIATLHGS